MAIPPAVQYTSPMKSPIRLLSILVAFQAFAAEARERWLFLGDSITQAGHYVDHVETWFLLNEADAPEIIDLGLGSETVSGLSEPDHPFPRPCVHTRLKQVIERVKPDLVIACYGMNCGIYHPFSEERFAAYQAGINRLVAEVQAGGARVVLLTPPPYAGRAQPRTPPSDGKSFGFKSPAADYNAVLAKYAEWILSLDGRNNVRAFDIRPPIEAHMEQCYPDEPIHPNDFGHELIAEAFLQGIGKKSVPRNDPRWNALIRLVQQQRLAYDVALLNDIGHGNPNVLKKGRLPLAEAEAASKAIDADIQKALGAAGSW